MVKPLHLPDIRHLHHRQPKDKGDKGDQHSTKAKVATKAALVNFMLCAK